MRNQDLAKLPIDAAAARCLDYLDTELTDEAAAFARHVWERTAETADSLASPHLSAREYVEELHDALAKSPV